MGNYFQEKKCYNKYKPSSSFSDFDCYGNNYFGNNQNNNNNFNDNYYDPNNLNYDTVNFSDNKFNNPYFKKRTTTKSTSESSHKNIDLVSIMIVVYFITFIISALIFYIGSTNIIGANSRIFLKALLFMVLESPIIYLVVWKLIINNLGNSCLNDEDEMRSLAFISIIALPIITLMLNMGLLVTLNKALDKSLPKKRYLSCVGKKKYFATNSPKDKKAFRRKKTSFSYDVYFNTWVSGVTITKNVQSNNFDRYQIGDVVSVNTWPGYFGFEYYDNLIDVDKNLFPDNTQFPLTEDEAKELMEQKKESEM